MRISDWSSDVCSSDLDGDPDRTGERSRDRGSRGVSEPGRLQRGSPLGRSGQPPGSGTGADRATGRRTLHGAGGIGRKENAGGGRAVVGIARLIPCRREPRRSEEHTSELQSLMRISYAVFCLKKKKKTINRRNDTTTYTNIKHNKHSN